jgi:maltose alpha-D-glucosyltransferase/alpha-amylase
MPDRRWFADKASRSIAAKISATIRIKHAHDNFIAAIADVTGSHGTSRYFLPLAIRWTRYTAIDRGPASVLAAVRRGPREGTLLDATAEHEFIAALMAKIHAGETVGDGGHSIEFRPTKAFADAPMPEIKTVHAVEREQSNSSVIVDNQYVVKILRRITPGIHPEVEIGRFLADVAHFQNAPTLLGSVELVEGENRSALAVVNAFVENQGDAWSITSASLDRFIDEQRLLPDEAVTETSETASMLQRMRQIGRRTAEMHLAFAGGAGIPAFAPEPISATDTAHWTDALIARAQNVFSLLERNPKSLAEPASALAERLLEYRDAINKHIESGRNVRFDGIKIRHHGDFHLGQVLIAKDDAYILDFEGEPRRSLEDRRRKEPPARDVAGFLRSIDYATSSAINRAPNVNPEDLATLTRRIRDWGDRLMAAYWECYRETLGEVRLWPADEAQSKELLGFFLLEKALYEIEYELTNRPSWSHIPLEATLRILQERGVIGP